MRSIQLPLVALPVPLSSARQGSPTTDRPNRLRRPRGNRLDPAFPPAHLVTHQADGILSFGSPVPLENGRAASPPPPHSNLNSGSESLGTWYSLTPISPSCARLR